MTPSLSEALVAIGDILGQYPDSPHAAIGPVTNWLQVNHLWTTNARVEVDDDGACTVDGTKLESRIEIPAGTRVRSSTGSNQVQLEAVR